MIFRVNDVQFSELSSRRYDLAVFASGYEERCTSLALAVGPEIADRHMILGFLEHTSTEQRRRNSLVLTERLGTHEIPIPHDQESLVFQSMSALDLPRDRPLEILVDYSSMSRTWFNAILNFFRFNEAHQPVFITFAYTVGEHQDLARSSWATETDFALDEVICLPGLEGGPMRMQSTVLVFGLGFEWSPPFGVCELIEPDVVHAFIADPGSFPEYGMAAEQRNAEFIREYVKSSVVRLPLRSVEATYRTLAELVLPLHPEANVALVPVGPKPHVLACILLASRFREVTCLYAKGSRRRPIRVRAASPQDVVGTRVELTGVRGEALTS